MIYLIGGPPKCGKTTLAKVLSKKTGISWVSTDTLQNLLLPYISEEKILEFFPTKSQKCGTNDEKYENFSSSEIISAYRAQAQAVFKAIDMFVISEIAEHQDHIIEGYHIEPELVSKLIEKYPGKIQALFLTKTNKKLFLENLKKSSTPNDWILTKTKKPETFGKIAHRK